MFNRHIYDKENKKNETAHRKFDTHHPKAIAGEW
jgi:hypothetical protein